MLVYCTRERQTASLNPWAIENWLKKLKFSEAVKGEKGNNSLRSVRDFKLKSQGKCGLKGANEENIKIMICMKFIRNNNKTQTIIIWIKVFYVRSCI